MLPPDRPRLSSTQFRFLRTRLTCYCVVLHAITSFEVVLADAVARASFCQRILACLLHYHTSAIEHKTLCELFGVPPSTMSRTLRKAEIALQKALKDIPQASVRWPTRVEQERWAECVFRKEPLLKGCFCVADGENYILQEPAEGDVQNAMYNGWLHSIKGTGVLCYGFDGTDIWGRYNFPGSWNDGVMSRQLQQVLSDAQCPAAAAPRIPRFQPRSGAWEVLSTLHLTLPYNPQLRALRLWNLHPLYNLRVRMTDISQIRSVFA
ncbi:TPA: hypothetical protein N0F65_007540 [Lagenidium giganteum]|uniref:DDE Tnp4 domain-containing protein n=1 Tax=Lagenidium giganteum TaxID=4803 RepID=A0AAV2ZER2_9STRA|nr:TPA: hypothetical protein N0F65_007540 [Lagenidium giganteum]